MLHEPAVETQKDHASSYKSVLGLRLFWLYGAVYFIGFVGINVLKPVLMEKTIIWGLNLAVVYGFGLILFALVLALIYNHMCVVRERKVNVPSKPEEGK